MKLRHPAGGVRIGVLLVFLACRQEDPGRELAQAQPGPPSGPVNVVLITLDTTRASDLGIYGGAAATPGIDALAADGVLFTDAHSVAFGTMPSHASLMASAPAAIHGIYDNETALRSSFVTLAEVLSGKGYITGAFVGATPLAYHLGIGQGFGTYDDEFVLDLEGDLGQFSRYERRADETVDRFFRWTNDVGEQPFFAWLHFYDPHQPYWPPGLTGEPEYLETGGASPEILALARTRYIAEIEQMDRAIGRVVRRLEAFDLYNSTLFVIVSDHGENFDEHASALTFGHAALFREVSQLPLVMKLPHSEKKGTRVDALIGNLDIAPTILDVLGVEQPGSWSGKSYRSVIDGNRDEIRGHLVLEGTDREEIAVRTRTRFYREVAAHLRSDPEVLGYLGYAPGQPEELYDVELDAGEMNNLFPSDEARPLQAIAARFLAKRDELSARAPDPQEHLKALKALGYVVSMPAPVPQQRAAPGVPDSR